MCTTPEIAVYNFDCHQVRTAFRHEMKKRADRSMDGSVSFLLATISITSVTFCICISSPFLLYVSLFHIDCLSERYSSDQLFLSFIFVFQRSVAPRTNAWTITEKKKHIRLVKVSPSSQNSDSAYQTKHCLPPSVDQVGQVQSVIVLTIIMLRPVFQSGSLCEIALLNTVSQSIRKGPDCDPLLVSVSFTLV